MIVIDGEHIAGFGRSEMARLNKDIIFPRLADRLRSEKDGALK